MPSAHYVLKLDLNTPAFLGDAEQRAEWRTPPLKAALRHWWRVASARAHDYNWTELLAREGELFGQAFGDHGRQARLRLALDGWTPGSGSSWGQDNRVRHPEVDGRGQVGAQLYLGYGPLGYSNGETRLQRKRTALEPGQTAELDVRVRGPRSEDLLDEALRLFAWFGTVGGRSRNGWGSLHVESSHVPVLLDGEGALSGEAKATLRKVPADLATAVAGDDGSARRDWAHGVGTDEGRVLVWRTREPFAIRDWRLVVRSLAEAKIAMRTALSLHGVPRGQAAPRHLLAYPVTNHHVNGWGKQGRLANQLRFKVVRANDKLYGLAVHLPCALPSEMERRLPPDDRERLQGAALDTWRRVHDALDGKLQRLSL